MSHMQAFYMKLSQPGPQRDRCQERLARLQHADLGQVLAVKQEVSWDIWHAENAAA